MYKILKAETLAAKIHLMVVHAPRVASHCQPGQFIIVKLDEKGERIPLTICDYDREEGTVTIVFQEIGVSTIKMAELKAGDAFRDFVGPLGCPSEFVAEDIEELKKKKMVFVAGGVGTAPVYPQVKWLHEHGITADVILGAKTKDMVILEKELGEVSNLYVTTDDGSYGRAGMVTKTLEDLVTNEGKHYDVCVAIGPMIMMKFVCLLTKKLGIHTIVSMNPIMVDGTGMCGACRLQVGDEIKFACVDGPEFDGHLVDFDQAMKRSQMYKTEEGREGINEVFFPEEIKARYVRMLGIELGWWFGYSLWSMDVLSGTKPSEGLSDVHFLRLTLKDKDGKVISENNYWRGNERTNFKALNQLPGVKLNVSSKLARKDGKATIQATVGLPKSADAVAFGVRVQAVRASEGERLLPALMNDNYFTLMPGEKKDIQITFDVSLLQNDSFKLIVEPYN